MQENNVLLVLLVFNRHLIWLTGSEDKQFCNTSQTRIRTNLPMDDG